MESWQKEIEYIENLYFKGKLFCKYRGDINSYLTETNTEGHDFIDLDAFYDIEINEVTKIKEETYKKKRKLHLIEKYDNEIRLNYNNETYNLTPNEFFIIPPINPEHEQTEEGQVHGTLIDQEVVFKLIRIKKRVVCIEGAIVLTETLKNGDVKEVYIADAETCEQRERIRKKCVPGTTTGKTKSEGGFQWEEYIINEDCKKGWRKTKITCVQDKPTGKNKIESGWYYEEFYNSDCSTYWDKIIKVCTPGLPTGDKRIVNGVQEIEYFENDCSKVWIKDEDSSSSEKSRCIDGKWTGKERKKEGWIQREYTRKDCSTYWKNHREIPGCSELLIPILLLIFVVLILISILYNTDIGDFLLGIGVIVLGYAAFIGLSLLLIRFATFFQIIFKYILYLLSLVFVVWILYSLGNGIKNWNPRKAQKERQERIIEDNQSEVTPPKKSELEDEKEDSLEDTSPDITDQDERKNDSLGVKIKWVNFDNNTYKADFKISMADVSSSRYNLRSVDKRRIRDISSVYHKAYSFDKAKLKSLFTMLSQLRKDNNMNDVQFAKLIVSMIQSLDYSIVIPENCSDVQLTGNREVQRMINAGYPCESPHPFGIKTPIEFLTSLKGDCDTRTVTLYTIFKYFNYDVVILNSDVYKHSMLGISLPGLRGDFKVHKGKKYLFWETTSPDNPIGFLPGEFGIINNWYIALN